MSRHSMLTRKSSAPVRIPLAEARDLPMVGASAQLHADLTEFAGAVEREDLPTLQRARPAVAELRARFAEVDRPADINAIAAAALTITTTMPMSAGIEPKLLSSLLCEDLAEMNITTFELQRAVREVRWAEEFLSMPALRDELRKARQLARHFRRALATDLDEAIKELKCKVRRYEHDREKQRAQARKECARIAEVNCGDTVPDGILWSYWSILDEDELREFADPDDDDEEAGE